MHHDVDQLPKRCSIYVCCMSGGWERCAKPVWPVCLPARLFVRTSRTNPPTDFQRRRSQLTLRRSDDVDEQPRNLADRQAGALDPAWPHASIHSASSCPSNSPPLRRSHTTFLPIASQLSHLSLEPTPHLTHGSSMSLLPRYRASKNLSKVLWPS
jgi:hypothetical protein